MCPYFAMFPEGFAEEWIERLTKPGDTVLDPFSGRGTTALQALLMGRKAVACDVNDVAYCLTKAKTNAPPLRSVFRRLTRLKKGFDRRSWWRVAANQSEFFHFAYAPRTREQLLYLRKVLRWQSSPVDAMIGALVLGSLHGDAGEQKPYLSNQMPRTISTKPRYSVEFWKRREMEPIEKDVFTLLHERASYRYESVPPAGEAAVFRTDMRELDSMQVSFPGKIRCAITSPPYLNVTNFEEDQWLRLWFLGGPARPMKMRLSRDDRHVSPARYWSFIGDMWRSFSLVLARNAQIVLRLGARNEDPELLQRKLVASCVFARRRTVLADWNVSEIRGRQTRAFRPGSRGSGGLEFH